MLSQKTDLVPDMSDNGIRGCPFHAKNSSINLNFLQIEARYLKGNSLCKYERRLKRRVIPYCIPEGRVVLVENEIHERTHRKSENSDTGIEDEGRKDSEPFVSSVGLFKSKSLENINCSSPDRTFTYDSPITLKNRQEEVDTSDVELVSSKMKCLNV